jgi:hypothetical protein
MAAMATCRACKQGIGLEAAYCPRCGVASPADPELQGPGFEWRSRQTIYGYPLIHVAFGKDARGKLKVAKGFIAIGQFAIGVITVAQFGVGLLFGFGQFVVGLTALAQFAGAILMGVGQFAIGYVAIGQIVLAKIGLAQLGWAEHLWSPGRRDPEAVEFFHGLWYNLRHWRWW